MDSDEQRQDAEDGTARLRRVALRLDEMDAEVERKMLEIREAKRLLERFIAGGEV